MFSFSINRLENGNLSIDGVEHTRLDGVLAASLHLQTMQQMLNDFIDEIPLELNQSGCWVKRVPEAFPLKVIIDGVAHDPRLVEFYLEDLVGSSAYKLHNLSDPKTPGYENSLKFAVFRKYSEKSFIITQLIYQSKSDKARQNRQAQRRAQKRSDGRAEFF